MIQAVLMVAVLGQASGLNIDGAWEYAKVRGSDALVVMVDGKVVHRAGDVDDRNQILASGTKSFCAVAMACAVQDGKVSGWDEKLEVALPEWKDDARGDITYRQLLSLSSGIGGESPGGSLAPPTEEQILAAKQVFPAGRRFLYGPMPFNVFSLAIERKLGGEKLHDYLERRIFGPLEMKVSYGGRQVEGRVQVAGMGRCSPNDWVKLGELMWRNGKLGDKQIWDAKAYLESQKQQGAGTQYGLTHWLSPEANPRTGGGADSEVPLFAAAGAGKQFLIVIPSERMVVVRTGRDGGSEGEFSGNEMFRLLLRK